jgi:hypothetical protein
MGERGRRLTRIIAKLRRSVTAHDTRGRCDATDFCDCRCFIVAVRAGSRRGFAVPSRAGDGKSSYPPAPRLADIMEMLQLRYPKLWYAGALKNWPLAEYELARIRDGLEDAAWYYSNIPADAVLLAAQPMKDLAASVKAKDGAGFARGFRALTGACNGCHEKAGLGYIAAKPPTSFLYSDQEFAPKR